MKRLNIYISLCAIIVSMSINSQEQIQGLQEVTQKAKTDLIELLTKTGDQFNFGVEAEDVRSSNSAFPMSYHEISFEKLLNYNGEQSMQGLLNEEIKKIIPLVKGNRLVTTVGVVKAKQGGDFKVTELIDHHYHKELNQLPNDIKEEGFRNMKVIYVPNLNIRVYHINGKNYTSYKGRNLSTSIDDDSLLQVLKNDATSFQSKYGDQLKEGKLLN